MTLQPEQSGGQGSVLGTALSPEGQDHEKGLQTRLGLLYLSNQSTWRKKTATSPSTPSQKISTPLIFMLKDSAINCRPFSSSGLKA